MTQVPCSALEAAGGSISGFPLTSRRSHAQNTATESISLAWDGSGTGVPLVVTFRLLRPSTSTSPVRRHKEKERLQMEAGVHGERTDRRRNWRGLDGRRKSCAELKPRRCTGNERRRIGGEERGCKVKHSQYLFIRKRPGIEATAGGTRD